MFWKKPPLTPSGVSPSKSRDELIAQAKADLKAARDDLGPETIAQMKALALAQQKMGVMAEVQKTTASADELNPAQRARELMKTMDKAKLADYIRTMSREED